MVAGRSDLAGLPDWPRRLSRAQAAIYVGLSPTSFDAEVAAGRMPHPIDRGRRKLWDRVAIDRVLDSEIGINPPSTGLMLDDPIVAAANAYQDRGRS